MTQRERSGNAFSLVELLIVMAVIGLLATIVVPSVIRTLAYARSLKCKANLKAISQAYGARKGAEGLKEFASELIVERWQAEFKPYLGQNADAFFCPETEQGRWWSLPKATMTIYNGSWFLYELEFFQGTPLWLEGAHNDYLPDKPGLWRVNDDVYNGGNYDRRNMPQYTPGSNPKISWWVIEDQRYGPNHEYATGDQDFNDLNIRVTDLGGGEYRVEGFHGIAGYNFGLRDDQGNEYREKSGGGIEPLTLYGEGGSYGVNWAISKFNIASQRILAMDYENSEVYAGSDVPANLENWDECVTAPHLGKVNYAMSTGEVLSARIEEIDPHNLKIDQALWDPRLR